MQAVANAFADRLVVELHVAFPVVPYSAGRNRVIDRHSGCPGGPIFWFTSAWIPAMMGDANDVPPAPLQLTRSTRAGGCARREACANQQKT